MTDRKSKHRLLKLEKLISTAEKEREKREAQLVKTLPYDARRHATEVAAIVLSGRARIDEPLKIAWARALRRYEINVNAPEGMDDKVRAKRLFPAIIGGEEESARFTKIFTTAPVWLLQFTLIAIDATLLKFQVPPDMSKRFRWGSAGYEDARRWPLLPLGTMTAGDPIPDNDPRRRWLDLFCIVVPGDPIKAFENRLSRGREEKLSRWDNQLVEDLCLALDLDEKPEEEWSGYEKRRMRRLSERLSRL
jgi:hypothetical protein